jgi:hypothetical protein
MAVMLGTAWHVTAQDAKATYSSMARLDQYLMEDLASEIALARSAAPESISRDAEVLVLGRHGYETAMKGKNGFVCIVQRSWTAPIDDPDFWNPKLRAPICFNGAPARSYLPRTIEKTDLILAGRTKAQMMEAIVAAIDKKELPMMEPGAMFYMLSKQVFERARRTLASPPDVFLFTNRPCSLGSGSTGFSDHRVQRHLGTPDYVPGSGATMVGWNG